MRAKLVSFLFLLLPLLSFALPADQARAVDDKDLDVWNRMVESKRREFLTMKESADLYAITVNRLAAEFKMEVARDEIRLHQIGYLLTVNRGNSYRFKLACSELASQTARFARSLEKIKEIDADIDRFINITEKGDAELRHLKSLDASGSLKGLDESLAMLDGFRDKLKAMKANVASVLEPGVRQLEKRMERLSGMNAEIVENLKVNLLTNRGCIYEDDMLPFLKVSFFRWLRSLPNSIVDKIPASSSEWTCSALVFLAAFLLALLALFRVFRTPLQRTRAKNEAAASLLGRSFVQLSIGAGFFCVGTFVLSIPANILCYHLGVIMMTAWAMDFAWALRLLYSEIPRHTSPLAPFFAVFIFGLATQIVDVPPIILSVVWPPVVLVLSTVVWKMVSGSGSSWMEPRARFQFRAISVLLVALAVLAFAGYANLSILLTMFVFNFSVGFQFARAISTALRRYVDARKAIGDVARTFILGFAIPLSWLTMLTASALWLANQLVDYKTCIDLCLDERSFGGVSFRPASVVAALFLFFVVKTGLGVVCSTMDKESMIAGEPPGYMSPFKTLISCLIWAGYSLMILNFFGVSISNLGVILGGLSVGIGFGLQNFVNNMVSGLMLLFGKDIREGDIIQVGDTWAKVQKISLRSTLAYSTDNAVISIPNSNLLSSQVVNWTLNNKHIRRDVKLPFAFGSDLDVAKDMLLKIAAANQGVMKLPSPEAFISSIGSTANEMTLRVWILDIEKAHQVISDLNRQIEGAFSGSSDKVALQGMASSLSSSKEHEAKDSGNS